MYFEEMRMGEGKRKGKAEGHLDKAFHLELLLAGLSQPVELQMVRPPFVYVIDLT